MNLISVLSNCAEYAGDADLVELIDEFVAGLEDEAMCKVLNDYDGLHRLAHQMKGAGGSSYEYQMLTEAGKGKYRNEKRNKY